MGDCSITNEGIGEFECTLKKEFEDGAENEELYSEESIRAFEFTFGKKYISTGGQETNSHIVDRLALKRGDFVLDVGCGVGGSAFYMASKGVKVHGVDLSDNTIASANQYLADEEEKIRDLVTFERNNILDCDFEENTFDLIYSRDAILYIEDKENLFKLLFKWLKPGGTLAMTDICEGEINLHNDAYHTYVKHYDLSLFKISDYKSLMEKIGFTNVVAKDETEMMMVIMNKELNQLKQGMETCVKLSNLRTYEFIVQFWENKLERFGALDNCWGHFNAVKPT